MVNIRKKSRCITAGLICLTLLPFYARAHSDLLLQIEQVDARIAAENPSADLLLKRGDLYRRHEDFAAAARDFEAARALSPDHELLDFYEGRLRLENGDPEAAELFLARYLSRHPHHARAWLLRGEAEIRLGNPGDAAEFFKQAIQTSSTPSPGLYRYYILATLATGETAWDSAQQSVDDGLDQFGAEVTLLGLGADIALARSRPGQAWAYLEQLSPGLSRLPQWGERKEIMNCMASSPEDRFRCLQLARNHLDSQVQTFMKEG